MVERYYKCKICGKLYKDFYLADQCESGCESTGNIGKVNKSE